MSALKRARLRAYLMLEVGVAGAMAAVVMGGLLVQLSSAQSDSTLKSRKVTAESLATVLVNETRTKKLADVVSSAGTRQVGGGTYSYVVTVGGSSPETAFLPSLETLNTDPNRDAGQTRVRSTLFFDTRPITVTVSWANGAHTVTAHARAYDLRPLR